MTSQIWLPFIWVAKDCDTYPPPMQIRGGGRRGIADDLIKKMDSLDVSGGGG